MPRFHALRALAPAFLVVSLMAAGGPASAQTLTGAAAQKSAQADVFIAYETPSSTAASKPPRSMPRRPT